MTPAWPPSRWVAEALAAAGQPPPAGSPSTAAIPWERGGPGVDWVCSLPLRLARGRREDAVGRAAALAAALAGRSEVAAVAAGEAGHLQLTLTDAALVAQARALPADWASSALPGGTSLAGPRRRRLDDPGYTAAVAHARLCRQLRGGVVPGGAAYGSHAVLVEAADALRVLDRLRADGRAHHLVDWITRVGAAVVTWSDDSAPVGGLPDPETTAALRDALADALRTVGVTPTERL